jgi:hypothetical protein
MNLLVVLARMGSMMGLPADISRQPVAPFPRIRAPQARSYLVIVFDGFWARVQNFSFSLPGGGRG